MARIGIDAHAIGSMLTGNETYIANLVDSLLKVESEHEYILYLTDSEAARKTAARYPQAEVVQIRPSWPLLRIPLVMPVLAKRNKIELLHVQYVGPPLINVPVVATIHDISFETHPEFFSFRERLQFKATFRLTARLCRKVLTISEHSRRDLIEIYGLPEDKVVVAYLAASPVFRPLAEDGEAGLRTVKEKYGVGDDYLLSVGNLQPRKNMVRMIKAYAMLRDLRPDIKCKLVIVGKKAWKHDPILSFVSRSPWASDIILTGYVPEHDLALLYAGARIFLYPSIYEGFGLPPLEAMACGTPVVVSDRTSLPEVVGDAGIKVNPFDINAIAAAIAALILEPGMAKAYGEAGLKRSSMFSWSKCAESTLAVYEDAIREDRES
ncbi:MAG: glycosyltransferase family 4 protein [Thermoleophilia bacterium]